MTEHIVGDWKDFTFQMVTTEDADLIAKHVRDHFLREEAMNILLGWSDENGDDHDRLVDWALAHGMSFIALKKDTGELAGINLILNGESTGDGLQVEPKSEICKKIFAVLSTVGEISAEAFRNNFDADNYAEIFITSVDKKFGGQGLATEMYRRSFAFMKAKGFKAVKSGFTSPATRAIGDKLGFSEIGRLYFKSHVNEKGEKTFPTAGDEDFVKEVAKKL